MAKGKTPVFDWDRGEFKTDSQGRVLIVEDAKALEQIVMKAHATQRGVYLAYADQDDPELNHKYGSDVYSVMLADDLTSEERDSELARTTKEAIVYDPWINDVLNVTIGYEEIDGKTQAVASYTLDTIFDTITVRGAVING